MWHFQTEKAVKCMMVMRATPPHPYFRLKLWTG